jgi:prepilin-type N-terminal cleavage/methylation domain-containing protein/prepilin-type processing-associated H-X9-DG protein
MPTRQSRNGFTLIELLVVIAIIAILIGLLLPAVQKVRESAANSQCKNNLHQLAVAVHTYHDTLGSFPCSATNGYNFNNTSPGCWSWMARILPYIEQGPLYKKLNIPTATMQQAAAFINQPVKTFLCPSDDAYNGLPRNDEANIAPLPVGQTNYKGVCGDNWAWGTYTKNSPTPPITNNGLDAGDGIFYRSDGVNPPGSHGPLRIPAIKDGTNSTFMIGEDIPKLNIHCDWPFFNHAVGTCAIPLNNAMQPGQPGYNNTGDWPNVYSFRSNHTNGANFAFADGHVTFVSDSINLAVYRALATYDGKEVANTP